MQVAHPQDLRRLIHPRTTKHNSEEHKQETETRTKKRTTDTKINVVQLSMECSAYIHGRSLKMSFIDVTMEIVTEPYNRRYRDQINTFSLYKPSL